MSKYVSQNIIVVITYLYPNLNLPKYCVSLVGFAKKVTDNPTSHFIAAHGLNSLLKEDIAAQAVVKKTFIWIHWPHKVAALIVLSLSCWKLVSLNLA